MYVLVGDVGGDQGATDQSTDHGDQSAARIEDLREQVAYLRDQLRREQDAHAEARRLLAGALERIPALEAPASPEPSEEPTEAAEPPGRVWPKPPVEEPQESAERPWWRKWFS